MRTLRLIAASIALAHALPANAAPVILTNHLGYDVTGPKRAVVQGRPGEEVHSCALEDETGGRTRIEPPKAVGRVARWRDWTYWTLDFSKMQQEGVFRVACSGKSGEVRSFPFHIGRDLLERHTLSDVLYYVKGQRSSGPMDEADRAVALEDQPERRIDAHGGWWDATGDYGKHLSHLSFSTYFNPQQLPLTAWGLLKAHALLQARPDPMFRQYLRRLLDEAAWGADYLVRVKAPGGSFFRSVSAPGAGKLPRDRRVSKDTKSFAIKTTANLDHFTHGEALALQDDAAYQSSFRSGAGLAIAALARAALVGAPGERRSEYLRTAEEAWTFLSANNPAYTNDGRENIVDDYCALVASTELDLATRRPEYKAAADARATSLLDRLGSAPKAYWHADDGDRPFFHASDAGFPVVSLLSYLEIADPVRRDEVLKAVRESLAWELAVTSEVANPFGYARQLVQTTAGVRETRFFYPHDAETAPWWQGEDARLASLAFAARLAIPHFAEDERFAARLRRYSTDQLNWILGLNPFDASLLEGTGRNNPEYLFFGSYEYTNAPGGIVNGITSGFDDPSGIDFNLAHTVTGADHDWRWGEQWLPHATWYLLAVAAGESTSQSRAAGRVIIGYVFPQDRLIEPSEIAADKLTHVNYAFANISDGKVIEGFARDRENLATLVGLRRTHPHLRILISVGGWTWSGGFSDAALTPESRQAFVASAVEFVRRHDLDGFDVDWEYPGLPGYANTHRLEDKENFTALMVELRAALDREGATRGRHYLLTFAAGAFSDFLAHTEMDKVQASVDYVNLMTYDFREAEGDPIAGHHANLYTHPLDPKQNSADQAAREFIAAGVPAYKLVLGAPFYGRAWGQVGGDAGARGLFQSGGPTAEPLATRYGQLSALVDRNGFERVWDATSQAPYLWNSERRIFVAYDDPQSLREKCRYIRDHGLAGAMFWEYYSDPAGTLLGTLYDELRGRPTRP